MILMGPRDGQENIATPVPARTLSAVRVPLPVLSFQRFFCSIQGRI